MRRRVWVGFAAAAVVLLILAGWSAVRPQGWAVDGPVQMECAPGIWGFLPSDPLPESDPKYAVSEECDDRTKAASMQAFLAGTGAVALGLVAILTGVLGRRRIPVVDPPWPTRY